MHIEPAEHISNTVPVGTAASGRRLRLLATLLYCAAAPAAFAALHEFMGAGQLEHYPLRATAGSLAAFAALTLAIQLRTLRVYGRGQDYHLWVACSLLAMGIPDAVHGVVRNPQLCAWLGSTAMLAGGLLIAFVWLPSRLAFRRETQLLPVVIALAAIIHTGISIAQPDWAPASLVGDELTLLAKMLNVAGSIGFLVAAAYFGLTYAKHGSFDRLLFCGVCVLFAEAGSLIAFSAMWDGTWWIGHLARLAAYGISIFFFFRVYVRDEMELRQSHEELEQRVEQRTSELRQEVEQREQAEHRIHVYAEELKRSNEDLEQFSYMASHDLSAPLRAVKCFCQLLQDRYADRLDDKGNEFIDLAVGGAQRMEQMLKGLLEYSRVDTRGKRLQATDTNEVLERALANLQIAIEDSGATVTRDDLPCVSADATQLEQLLQNLIGNAVKFQSTETPHVHVTAERDGDRWVFAVRDNGIGIDPRNTDYIFQIFHRLDTERKFPGTGIGLAVCKRILERHAGRMWVESEPGRGSTFYFTLAPAEQDNLVASANV